MFSWSYANLAAESARAFRLIGLYPGHDFDEHAMAALAGTDLRRARWLLADLTRAHLVQPARRGRYGVHDLLRAYAVERAADDPPADRRAALARLFDHHLHACSVAMDLVTPFERDRRPTVPDPGWPAPQLPDATAAIAWLDAERPNLIAAAEQAPGSHAGRLAVILNRYLDLGAHYHDAELLYGRVVRTAAVNHRAHALTGLGIVYWQLGRTTQTLQCGRRGLDLYRELGDRIGQARVLGNLGTVYGRLGDYPAAMRHHQQALDLFRDAGDPAGVGNELSSLGAAHEELGHFPEALEYLREALAVSRQTGYRETEAQVLGGLGIVYRRLGRFAEAIVPPSPRHADRRGARRRPPDRRAAQSPRRRPARRRPPEEGPACLPAALAITHRTGNRYQQARAHHGIACILGTGDEAPAHWERALTIYTELGVPEADEVRAQLEGSGPLEIRPHRLAVAGSPDAPALG